MAAAPSSRSTSTAASMIASFGTFLIAGISFPPTTTYVKESLRSRDDSSSCYGQHSRYSSYGFGFVKFAAQEKHLFRWLYLDGGQTDPYQYDVLLPEIISVIMDEYGYSEEIAQKLHRDMTYYSYGLAILASTDHLDLTDEELLAAFRREFTALAAYYGVSQCQR